MIRRSPDRTRDALLILLALTTGATDVAAFVRLGHVFASVITGNLILLGASAVSTDGSLALHAGLALAGYAVGVLLAASRRRERREHPEHQPIWPRAVSLALALEFVVLAGFAVVWEVVHQLPGHATQLVLLALASAAMGVQSSAVRRLGQMSTTYLTSTLTGVLEALVAREYSAAEARSIGILVAAVAGAAAGLALIRHAGAWLPVLQLGPLVVVLAAAPGGLGLLRGGRASSSS